jgi:hypothetical protein
VGQAIPLTQSPHESAVANLVPWNAPRMNLFVEVLRDLFRVVNVSVDVAEHPCAMRGSRRLRLEHVARTPSAITRLINSESGPDSLAELLEQSQCETFGKYPQRLSIAAIQECAVTFVTSWLSRSTPAGSEFSRLNDYVETALHNATAYRMRDEYPELDDFVAAVAARRNVKLLGSGPNRHVADFYANELMRVCKHPLAVDVLENHKHIDMSAEASCLVLIANTSSDRYARDVEAEIDKLLSHNNHVTLICRDGDSRFSALRPWTCRMPGATFFESLSYYDALLNRLRNALDAQMIRGASKQPTRRAYARRL